MSNKKLIAFSKDQIEMINIYCEETNNTKFTNAVRDLIDIGLNHHKKINNNEDEIKIDNVSIKELIDKVEKLSWWTIDENTSKLSDIENQVSDIEKRLNTIISISKYFKAHINNKEIHLQD